MGQVIIDMIILAMHSIMARPTRNALKVGMPLIRQELEDVQNLPVRGRGSKIIFNVLVL